MNDKAFRTSVSDSVNEYLKNVNGIAVDNPLIIFFQNDLRDALEYIGLDIALKAIEKQIVPTEVHPSASLIFQAIAQYRETGMVG